MQEDAEGLPPTPLFLTKSAELADSKRVRNRLILKGRQNALAGILSKECASEST